MTRVLRELDPKVGDLVEKGRACLYVTVSGKGVPVGQVITPYPGPDGETIDVATGVSYPLKADRVRRDPHTTWLLESRSPTGAGYEFVPGPVAVVAALGAVRDADIQEGTDRFMELYRDWCIETLGTTLWESFGVTWETARAAVWMWPRIWVQAIPTHVWLWPDGDVRSDPQVWRAPAGVEAPVSDPAPPARAASAGGERAVARSDWRPSAERALAADGMVVYLMFNGPEGYAWPTRVGDVTLVADGFELELPGWCPSAPQGQASLHFAGAAGFGGPTATFVGTVEGDTQRTRFTVVRGSGDVSTVQKLDEVFEPPHDLRGQFMDQLHEQLERRGQPVPIIRMPEERERAISS